MARPDQQDSTDTTVLSRAAGIAGIVYVLLYFIGNFATGVGDNFYGNHPPAEVVTWTNEHQGLVRFAVFNDLVIDLMFVLFVLLLVALSRGRSIPALVAYVGVGISNAVLMVILGLQLSVAKLAQLPNGDALAQAAVVLQWTLEGSLRAVPLVPALAALGYMMTKSRTLPAAFGMALVVLSAILAIGMLAGAIGAPAISFLAFIGFGAAVFGLKLWIIATSIAVLAWPNRVARREAARPQFQP